MQEALKAEFNREGETLHVDLGGHLNQETSEDLSRALEREYADGYCQTVMGFEEIQFIGSAGFRVLLQSHRSLEAAGFKLTLRQIPIRIMAVIKSLGFDKMFTIE